MTDTEVREALRQVVDPELGVNIVDLGLIQAIDVAGTDVRVTMTMTTPACPLRDYIQDLVESTLLDRLGSAQRVTVTIVDDPPWSPDMMSEAARRQLG
jgi:metal-sulfur cluster biosynthetic enzyme